MKEYIFIRLHTHATCRLSLNALLIEHIHIVELAAVLWTIFKIIFPRIFMNLIGFDGIEPYRIEPNRTGSAGTDRNGPERTKPKRTGQHRTGPDHTIKYYFFSLNYFCSILIFPLTFSYRNVRPRSLKNE